MAKVFGFTPDQVRELDADDPLIFLTLEKANREREAEEMRKK